MMWDTITAFSKLNGKEVSTGVCRSLVPITLALFCGSLREDGAGKRAGSYASLCSTEAGRNSPTPRGWKRFLRERGACTGSAAEDTS